MNYVLLEALKLRKNQCFTVGALEKYLMEKVPHLNNMQNPLAKIEPSYKRDFILFGIPQKQQLEDIKLTIKIKAYDEEYTKPQLAWEPWWKI